MFLILLLVMAAPARPSVITLEQAIDECIAFSPDLRAAAESVEQSQGDLKTASLLPNPTLLFLSSLQPFAGHPFSPIRQGGPPQFDVSLLWPVDWLLFGKIFKAKDAVHKGLDANRATHENTIRQRVALTTASFFAVLEAKELARLAHEHANNLSEVSKLTQKKITYGGASNVDGDHAILAANVAQREAREAEFVLFVARSQLRAVLGRPSPAPDFDVVGTLEPIKRVPTENFDEAYQRAQTHRPDIQALQLRIAQAKAQLAHAHRDAFPAMNLQGGFSYQDQQKAIGYPGAFSWSLGMSMEIPTFDRNQGHILKAQALTREAELRLEAALVQLQSELEQALHGYELADTVVNQDLPLQLRMVRAIRTRMMETYSKGGQTLVDVLDAERDVLETTRLNTIAQVGYWRALYRLRTVLGEKHENRAVREPPLQEITTEKIQP